MVKERQQDEKMGRTVEGDGTAHAKIFVECDEDGEAEE